MPARVIYVAGQSFSGSTFFSAMLGTHPDIEPVSELATWPKRGLDPGRLCACGKRSAECDYWTAVRSRWTGGSPDVIPRYVHLQSRIERISLAWPQLFGAPRPATPEREEYLSLTASLFQSALDVSGRGILVDSSKKPGRAIAISKMDDPQVFILHLVRSGFNYVDSNIRRGLVAPGQPGFLYRVFRLGLSWAASNFAAERAMVLNGSRGMRLRYEDVLSDPAGTLETIGRQLDIDVRPIREHLASGQPVSFRHMDSGSWYRKHGPAPLRADLNSSAALDGRVRLAFRLGAGLFTRRYGYR
jgi:hypothetical protein